MPNNEDGGGGGYGGLSTFSSEFMGWWNHLNEAEKSWFLDNWHLAPTAAANKLLTDATTKIVYGCNSFPDNNNFNAFRHAYWSALNACSFGASMGQTIANNHEVGSSGINKDMDDFNNALGVSIGASLNCGALCICNKGLISYMVLNAIDSGAGKDILGREPHLGQVT